MKKFGDRSIYSKKIRATVRIAKETVALIPSHNNEVENDKYRKIILSYGYRIRVLLKPWLHWLW